MYNNYVMKCENFLSIKSKQFLSQLMIFGSRVQIGCISLILWPILNQNLKFQSHWENIEISFPLDCPNILLLLFCQKYVLTFFCEELKFYHPQSFSSISKIKWDWFWLQKMSYWPMYGGPRPMHRGPGPMYGGPRPMYGGPLPKFGMQSYGHLGMRMNNPNLMGGSLNLSRGEVFRAAKIEKTGGKWRTQLCKVYII